MKPVRMSATNILFTVMFVSLLALILMAFVLQVPESIKLTARSMLCLFGAVCCFGVAFLMKQVGRQAWDESAKNTPSK